MRLLLSSELRGSGGGGGPNVTCRILTTPMSHVIVARNRALSLADHTKKLPRRMSLTDFQQIPKCSYGIVYLKITEKIVKYRKKCMINEITTT